MFGNDDEVYLNETIKYLVYYNNGQKHSISYKTTCAHSEVSSTGHSVWRTVKTLIGMCAQAMLWNRTTYMCSENIDQLPRIWIKL